MSTDVRARWLSRWARGAVAFALAVVLAAAGASVLVPHPAAAPAAPDEGCTSAFPVRMTPEGTGFYGAAIALFVVCQDSAGTSTLLQNLSAAVWVLDSPRQVAVHRESVSLIDRSFLDLARSPAPVVPPGTSVALPSPASEITARVDPRLTIAALAHERLAMILLVAAPSTWKDSVLAASRTALTTCIGTLLDQLPSPGSVLLRGNPGRRIADVAAAIAADLDSPCVRQWTAARIGTASVGIPIASLAQDVRFWQHDPEFALTALQAAITYSALARRAAT